MDTFNVLIIGGGGREHALAWGLSKSPKVKTVFCSPGNGGMAAIGPLVSLDLSQPSSVSQFIKEKNISLTVIGPEAPLVAGLADDLRKDGHLVVGTDKKGAQLEGSKIFAKNFMAQYGIPTADFKTFSDPQEAKKFAQSPNGKNFKILKADGLAAGKGVYVNNSTSDVIKAIDEVMVSKKFGAAGDKIVLEEKMEGPEISVIALTDGKTILPFPASQDHKRAFDDDKGPNTGGMGAYAPTPFFTDELHTHINVEIIDRFIKGLASEKIDFRGFIYFGLMLTPNGPRVLEFNVRFGDPEAQAVLPLIDSDLFDLFSDVAKGSLTKGHITIKDQFACTVVMASKGYPGSYEKGFEIKGLDEAAKRSHVYVFHAGTKKEGDKILTSGGRVVGVTGLGNTLDEAVVHAYQGVKRISFKNCFSRSDIASKAIKNKNITLRVKRTKAKHVNEFAFI